MPDGGVRDMEVGRRTFVGLLIGAGVALATPALSLLERLLPARYTEAVRSRRYPGPVRDLDDREIRRPGRWAG